MSDLCIRNGWVLAGGCAYPLARLRRVRVAQSLSNRDHGEVTLLFDGGDSHILTYLTLDAATAAFDAFVELYEVPSVPLSGRPEEVTP